MQFEPPFEEVECEGCGEPHLDYELKKTDTKEGPKQLCKTCIERQEGNM